MSAPKSRGWEKAKASPAPTPATPMGQLSAFVDGLSETEKASHRAAYLHLLQSMTGCNVNIECTDGRKLTGVFHAATPFEQKPHAVVVKGTRLLQDNAPVANGANDGKTAVLKFNEQVSTISTASKIDLVSKTYSSEFQTDSAIKKHGDMSHLSGRNLQCLDSSWLETAGDMSLDSKSTKTWDQFEVNKRLFNVKDTYDENLYTKRLDLKSMTAEQIARADRLAREIEGSVSGNIHLQEERGQVTEGDWDEEDRFSGVLRGAEGSSDKGKKSNKTTIADSDNAWKRGGRPGQAGSGTASPATPATATTPAVPVAGAAAKTNKPVTPPPGMAASPKKAAPVPAAAASSDAAATTKEVEPAAVAAKAVGADAVDTKASAASTDAAPVAAATVSTTPAAAAGDASASAPAAPAVDAPKPASKLRVTAAEFKPSWMVEPKAAPATPVQQIPVPPVPVFVPPQNFQHVPYGVPMSPDGGMPPPQMYQNKVHNSPGPHPMGASSPNTQPMHEMPPPYYENAPMGMMALPPHNGFPGMEFQQPPMNPGFMYSQHPGQMPMNMGMPMGMVPMQGMPGMPMDFQNANGMNMGMGQVMMPFPPPQPFYPSEMGMMSPNGQPMMQPNYGGYNQGSPYNNGQPQMGYPPNGQNMGSGQKMGYDKGGMRGPNKGGRGVNSGMKPGGYNNNMNRGAGMNNSNNMPNNGPGTPVAGPAPVSRAESEGAEA